jgi:hypothetical protein
MWRFTLESNSRPSTWRARRSCPWSRLPVATRAIKRCRSACRYRQASSWSMAGAASHRGSENDRSSSTQHRTICSFARSNEGPVQPAGWRRGCPASNRRSGPFASVRSPQGCDSRSVGWRSRSRAGHPRRQDPAAARSSGSRYAIARGFRSFARKLLTCSGKGTPPRAVIGVCSARPVWSSTKTGPSIFRISGRRRLKSSRS